MLFEILIVFGIVVFGAAMVTLFLRLFLGKNLTVKSYDAGHGFANPSNPTAYNAEATSDANRHMITYFKSKF